jgi:tRNA pseudouridine55 synthase
MLIIDKPAGLTSHDVVSRVRRILKTKRVGHTGTLDPFATGVMVILVGKATRLARFLDKDVKEYVAGVRFGSETDTGDLTGKSRDISFTRDPATLTIDEIEKVLAEFRGEIMQTPPMYSAKKVAGKKLYEHARKGEEIERKPIACTIYQLEMLAATEVSAAAPVIHLKVSCSAGTYVRTLAEDIGRSLETGAHLTSLRRVAAGKFGLSEALKLEDLANLADPATALLPLDRTVSHLQRFELTGDRAEKTRGGLSTRTANDGFRDGEFVRMTTADGSLIAVGVYDEAERSVRPTVVLV